MRSVVYSRTGDPSVLRLVDRDVADPEPGEVRVRIAVSGVNPTDWKSRLGSGDGAAPPFPAPAKAALTTAAGAHHVVNYRDEDASAAITKVAPDGVDLVVEVAIAANYRLNIDVVRPRASFGIYANDGGGDVKLDVRQNMIKNLRYQFVLLYTVGDAALTAAVEDITSALMDGALPVGEDAGLPLHRFPLASTADAHQAVEDGAVGKVLIDIA